MEQGINPRLLSVVKAVNDYCGQNGVQYDVACDESDIQGLKIFQKNRRFVNGLLGHIQPTLEKQGVHLETQAVRGGTILAFSLEALSENKIEEMIKNIGESVVQLPLRDRINDIMYRPVSESPAIAARLAAGAAASEIDSDDLDRTAKSIVGGDTDDESADDSNAQTGSTTGASPGIAKGTNINFENRIAKSMGLKTKRSPGRFRHDLHEALLSLEFAPVQQAPQPAQAAQAQPTAQPAPAAAAAQTAQPSAMSGMATSMSSSPDELFKRFAKSLQVLGDQMGIGPLQDRLREQGIKWKKSDDGMNVILYIQNAATNAPQPVARISAEVLEKPNDFEKALKDILDFSKGEAPGAFQQQQDAMRDQEKAIRDISKSVSPEQQSEIAQQMHSDQPAQPQPGPSEGPLDVDAAQQAAALK